ncbi:MAG TPA: hypothetical protein VM914_04380 [Pyrinomonadaceae bacterium]|jgi:hypothetical protein|nr:hypothetical protein [Pyrinomonadaceae bacterium]
METLAVGERNVAARAGVAAGRRRERLFYTGMAAAFVLTVFAGFARTYYLRPYFDSKPLVTILHLHGLLFTSWIVLFVVQTALVAKRRTDVHRRLGVAGALLAALMVLVGVTTALVRAKAADVGPGGISPLAFLTVPLGDMLVFAILVGAGVYFRGRPDAHKRLMLLSTIAILPAAVARLPLNFIQQGGPPAFFGLSDLFIIPCLLYDLFARGRFHRATVAGGLLIVVSQALRGPVGNTSAWLAFAAWLTRWF